MVEAHTRPVILLSLHFGPPFLLTTLLRAQGLPAAIVAFSGMTSSTAYRRWFEKGPDRAAGLENVSRIIETGCIGEMYDHLAANRILIIDIDAGGGRHLATPHADGCGFIMSTGALKLAALTNAIVLPCLVTSAPFFGWTIHLGEPIPAISSGDEEQRMAACKHVLREFLPVLRNAPEECSSHLLERLVMSPIEARPPELQLKTGACRVP
jgi:lauroyl/myristoyl acyltransferase